MKTKQFTIKDHKHRLEISRKRTKDLHSQIGINSSCFSLLESRVVYLLSQSINNTNPEKAHDIISILSFRQSVSLVRKFIPQWYSELNITTQVKELTKRLDDVSERRNEFIHSYWVNYHPNLVAQKRPRSKAGKSIEFEMHDKTIINKMNSLIEEMDKLILDLDSFICELCNKTCEQER